MKERSEGEDLLNILPKGCVDRISHRECRGQQKLKWDVQGGAAIPLPTSLSLRSQCVPNPSAICPCLPCHWRCHPSASGARAGMRCPAMAPKERSEPTIPPPTCNSWPNCPIFAACRGPMKRPRPRPSRRPRVPFRLLFRKPHLSTNWL